MCQQGATDGGLWVVEQAKKSGLEFGAELFVIHGLYDMRKRRARNSEARVR